MSVKCARCLDSTCERACERNHLKSSVLTLCNCCFTIYYQLWLKGVDPLVKPAIERDMSFQRYMVEIVAPVSRSQKRRIEKMGLLREANATSG